MLEIFFHKFMVQIPILVRQSSIEHQFKFKLDNAMLLVKPHAYQRLC